MKLILRLENAGDVGAHSGSRRELETGQLTIGRGKEANWVLPDRSRFMSSVHCTISATPTGFVLCDKSRNGLTVNGKLVAANDETILNNGDRIEIGPFVIAASLIDAGSDDRTVIGNLATPATAPGNRAVIIHANPPPNMHDRTVIAVQSTPKQADATVIVPAKQMAAVTREEPAPVQWQQHNAPVRAPQRRQRMAKASGSGSVVSFAEGAGMDPEALAGRNDIEFTRELGEVLAAVVSRLALIAQSVSQFRALVGAETRLAPDHPLLTGGGSQRLLQTLFSHASDREEGASQLLANGLDDLAAHERAVFAAMQAALFRLLNGFSPTSIEAQTGSSLIRSKKAKNWDAYVRLWEEMSGTGENGLLDVLLANFREEYDRLMRGL